MCVRENGLFNNCARTVGAYKSKWYAMYGMQATAGVPGPKVCVCERMGYLIIV